MKLRLIVVFLTLILALATTDKNIEGSTELESEIREVWRQRWVALSHNDAETYGGFLADEVVAPSNGVVYDKKARLPEMRHIDYGLSILRSSAFDGWPSDVPLDLATVLQRLLVRGRLAGFEVKQRFYEVGSPAGIVETERFILAQNRSLSLREGPAKLPSSHFGS